MKALKIKLDRNIGFALACGQVASNPRANRRHRVRHLSGKLGIFVSSSLKGLLGVWSNKAKAEYPRHTCSWFEAPSSTKTALKAVTSKRTGELL